MDHISCDDLKGDVMQVTDEQLEVLKAYMKCTVKEQLVVQQMLEIIFPCHLSQNGIHDWQSVDYADDDEFYCIDCGKPKPQDDDTEIAMAKSTLFYALFPSEDEAVV